MRRSELQQERFAQRFSDGNVVLLDEFAKRGGLRVRKCFLIQVQEGRKVSIYFYNPRRN